VVSSIIQIIPDKIHAIETGGAILAPGSRKFKHVFIPFKPTIYSGEEVLREK